MLALAGLTGCLPDYESGKTECSTGGLCPAGFTCLEGLCYTVAAQPGGPGLAGSASMGACSAPLPKLCPALGDRPAICTQSAIECATVVDCDGDFGGCPSAQTTYDCAAKRCVAAPVGQRCSTALARSDGSNPCGACLARKCCEALITCADDTTCIDGHTGPKADALNSCGDKFCLDSCPADPGAAPP
jgi:hypothetical protein